tara:strand:+ start:93 stop:254 length:162 start_codon:yes stop_codon:yes gene_type:complete
MLIIAGRFSTLQDARRYQATLALDGTFIQQDHDRGDYKVIAWRNGNPKTLEHA